MQSGTSLIVRGFFNWPLINKLFFLEHDSNEVKKKSLAIFLIVRAFEKMRIKL